MRATLAIALLIGEIASGLALAAELPAASASPFIDPNTYLLLHNAGLTDTTAIDPRDPKSVEKMVDEAIQRFLERQAQELHEKE